MVIFVHPFECCSEDEVAQEVVVPEEINEHCTEDNLTLRTKYVSDCDVSLLNMLQAEITRLADHVTRMNN